MKHFMKLMINKNYYAAFLKFKEFKLFAITLIHEKG